ncbi:hypothetical protein PoB_000717900 [Plakobranchus ocellatus]|uniref:Uncharacterized protein n=1 Tax=Plakobranchus ocellatus TaxID=259542 RepID=A0AAV3YEH6_9GAST|nr:hypothetical protein PoB_000717900 [Plakobranchus ocellatus]
MNGKSTIRSVFSFAVNDSSGKGCSANTHVTNNENAIEPANISSESPSQMMITRMGVMYDPTAGLRMRFLQRKFAHLLDGFMALREAAYRPFIRCQRPKKVDVAGQGKTMPAVVKAFHPEVYVTYTHPSTFAFKEKWTKIFNSNFVSVEDILRDLEDKETQTSNEELFLKKRYRRAKAERGQ